MERASAGPATPPPAIAGGSPGSLSASSGSPKPLKQLSLVSPARATWSVATGGRKAPSPSADAFQSGME